MTMTHKERTLKKSITKSTLVISSLLFIGVHSNSVAGSYCNESHNSYTNTSQFSESSQSIDNATERPLSTSQNARSVESEAELRPLNPSTQSNVANSNTSQTVIAQADTNQTTAVNSTPEGKSIWEKNCSGCHGSGVAGAPKIGNKEAWTQRFQKGIDTLVTNANNGFTGQKGTMPAKGGNSSLSDVDVGLAVKYMVSQSL